MVESQQFDPYHKWLGIPPHEQPPNHYRMLRIELFESDPEVIENAYEKELADFKAQEHGPQADFVDQVSRELIAAHRCLLDPGKKKAYDSELLAKAKADTDRHAFAREQADSITIDQAVRTATTGLIDERSRLTTLAAQASARERQALLEVDRLRTELQQLTLAVAQANMPLNAPEPSVEIEPPKAIAAPHVDEKSVRDTRRLFVRARWLAPLNKVDQLLANLAGDGNALLHQFLRIVAVMTLIAIFLGVISLAGGRAKKQRVSETAKSNAQETGKDAHSPADIADKENDNPNSSDEAKPDGSPSGEVPKTSNPGNTGEVTDSANEPPIVPVEPRNGEAKKLTLHWKKSPFSNRVKVDSLALEEASGFGGIDTDSIIEASDKSPLPNDVDHEKSLSEVLEAFPTDSADTPDKKLALARRMYDLALEEADGATRFALLTAAHELALTSSHVKSSMRIVDAIRMLFETGGNEFHSDLLNRAAADSSKDAADSVATATLLLVERSVQAGEFELAQRLLEQAMSRAKDTANPLLTQTAEAIADELPALEAQYREAQSAVAPLEQTPDDPQASERVGRFMCFVLGDWDQGLPLLSRADDPGIQEAAKSDLAFPLDPTERVNAGDLWWDLSEKSDDSMKVGLRDRAAYWYERTAGQLTGLTKERIADRLNRIREEAKSEALAELPSSARELVGQYIVKLTNRMTNQTTFSIWELRDDLTTTADGTTVAYWEATGSTGFRLLFLDSPQSPVYLRFRGPKVPLTGARTINGVTFAMEFARLSVVAVWEHKTESFTSRFGQVTPGGDETLTFYSNGRVNDPLGQIAWVVQGRNLAIDWGQGKKTVAMLSADGTTYTGKTGVGRTTMAADVNGRRITKSE